MGECYGLVDQKNHPYYTYLSSIFEAIGNEQKQYNWLITDCEAYPHHEDIGNMLSAEYCWLTGEELTALTKRDDFQWIWAVLTGFDKNIPLSEILKYPLPEVLDSGGTYCRNPVSMQHPLATIEIVPFDSSYTIILSRNKSTIDHYKAACPNVSPLSEFNE